MQNVAPAINQASRGRALRLAFLSAVVSLAAVFAASAAPIPCSTGIGPKTGSPTPASRWPSSPTTCPPSPHCWCCDNCPIIWVDGPPRSPASACYLLPVAAAMFLATWATGAFYQAFVPALVEDQLHTRSTLILGLVFAANMAPSALGAPSAAGSHQRQPNASA